MARLEHTPRDPHKTPKELAEAANVSVSAVLKWIREGRIKAVSFGTAHRIPASEYDRVLRDGVGDTSTPMSSRAKQLNKPGRSPRDTR